MTHDRNRPHDTHRARTATSPLRPEISEALRGMDWYGQLEVARAMREKVLAERARNAERAARITDREDGVATAPAEADAARMARMPASPPQQPAHAASAEPRQVLPPPETSANTLRDAIARAREWREAHARTFAEHMRKAEPGGLRQRLDRIDLTALSERLRAGRDRIGGAIADSLRTAETDGEPARRSRTDLGALSRSARETRDLIAASLSARLDRIARASLADRARGLGGRIGRAIRQTPERGIWFGTGAAVGLAIGAGTVGMFAAFVKAPPPAPPSAAAGLYGTGEIPLMLTASGPDPIGPVPPVAQVAPDVMDALLPALPAASAMVRESEPAMTGPVIHLSADAPSPADIAPAPASAEALAPPPEAPQRDAADGAEADTPAGTAASIPEGPFVLVFFQEGARAGHVSAVTEALEGTGMRLASTTPVTFRVTRDHVRFFRPEDRPAAARLADATGAELRDFTHYRPLPPTGAIELWLSES